MKKLVLIAALAFAISGCSFFNAAASDVKDFFTPCDTIVANLKADATFADTGVLAYDTLPTCGTPDAQGKVCAKLSIVRKLGLYRRSAYTAIKGIDKVCSSNLVDAARTAVTTFKAVAAQYAPPLTVPPVAK